MICLLIVRVSEGIEMKEQIIIKMKSCDLNS